MGVILTGSLGFLSINMSMNFVNAFYLLLLHRSHVTGSNLEDTSRFRQNKLPFGNFLIQTKPSSLFSLKIQLESKILLLPSTYKTILILLFQLEIKQEKSHLLL